jgi:sugar lactone lactonase YvrE
VLALCVFLPAGVSAESPGFLLVTAPRESRISYVRLPENGSFEHAKAESLIDDGLRHPQGLAVDQKRKRLLVADPDAKRVYSYQLVISGDSLDVEGEPFIIARNAESRWVAVDGIGNVFFSDEPQNLILKVPADRALRGHDNDVEIAPEVVYDGSAVTMVNQPGGIAVDNFHLYWTNKHFGMQSGSLVKGNERPLNRGDVASVSALARNAVKCYGVCLALGNVYYTGSEHYLWGVKKGGGPIAEVTSHLQRPRGCAWDGDGTVYVADRGAGAIYSFAGNMHSIAHAEVRKAFDYEDAFGLAVLATSSGSRLAWSAAAAAVSVLILGRHVD